MMDTGRKDGQMKIQAYGWCCNDCLFYLAKGDLPKDRPDFLADVAARVGNWNVDLGGEHLEGCPNVDQESGEWIGSSDCDCEEIEFSWSQCDVCGSGLGGSRDAVHFFTLDGRMGK